MSSVPNPPRTQGVDHETSHIALQKWIWSAVAGGWSPTGGFTDQRWTHDDNMAAQPLGFMITKPPGSKFYELYSITRSSVLRENANWLMKQLIEAASIDPLCAKAVGVLTAQKLANPDRKFAYDFQDN